LLDSIDIIDDSDYHYRKHRVEALWIFLQLQLLHLHPSQTCVNGVVRKM